VSTVASLLGPEIFDFDWVVALRHLEVSIRLCCRGSIFWENVYVNKKRRKNYSEQEFRVTDLRIQWDSCLTCI